MRPPTETTRRDAGQHRKAIDGVSAGQWRWRWDLNPRRSCPLTRFRGLPRGIHRGLRAFRHAQRRSTRPYRNRPERTRMRLEMRPREGWHAAGESGSLVRMDAAHSILRREIGRSAVRPRPWPLSEPQVIALVTCGFVRLGVRSPMTANGRETPGLTASCPELGHELGHGYRCGASLMRSGVGTSWSTGHDVYRTAGSDDDDGSAVLAHFVRGVARGWGSTGRTCISSRPAWPMFAASNAVSRSSPLADERARPSAH